MHIIQLGMLLYASAINWGLRVNSWIDWPSRWKSYNNHALIIWIHCFRECWADMVCHCWHAFYTF